MKYSENYEFNLPNKADNDPADIDDLSENFELIDEILKNHEGFLGNNAKVLEENEVTLETSPSEIPAGVTYCFVNQSNFVDGVWQVGLLVNYNSNRQTDSYRVFQVWYGQLEDSPMQRKSRLSSGSLVWGEFEQYVTKSDLTEEVETALTEAKESGDFKGDSYVLTETDKQEIAGESRGNTYISLPDSVNVKVGNEFKVYYRNIISRDDIVLWVGYNNNLTTRYYDDYLSIIANTTGTHSLPWKVFDKGSNLIDSGEFNIIATAKVPTNTTIALVIGDSTVNADTMTDKTKALYTADGANLNLLGTRGNGHEGRGGWTAKMYCTEASSGGVDNPFYNNGFDFAYYMTNQNYSGVQAVAIQLGINDIFAFKDYDWALYDSSEVLGYINQMVTSILAYDSSVKVVINLPTTPNSNGTSFTEAYGTTQLYWTYNRNIIRFAEELKDYFANNASVTISASNCILDTKTQIRDGVHPTEEGYNALGQRLYEVLISIVEGGVVVVPLLDISQRTRVVHSGNTIAATAVHALDATKCYDTTFNGIRSDTTSNAITSYTPTSSSSFILNQNTCGGQGIEFPVPFLEVGKTYTVNYTVSVSGRVYLIKYTSDGVYSSNEALSTKAGTFTKTITPESGYIYSLCFCSFTANTDCIFSGVSLTEN